MAKRRAKRTGRTGRRGRGMSKGTKTLLVVGAAAGLGYLAYRASQQPAPPQEGLGPGGRITLQIIPADGGVGYGGIGAIPTSVMEGSTGNQAVVTVTNTSVYAGSTTKAPYTFGLQLQVAWADNTIIQVLPGVVGTLTPLALAASATGSVTWSFTIPYGRSGAARATAILYPTAGGSGLAQAVADFTVTSVTVTPGGTITW